MARSLRIVSFLCRIRGPSAIPSIYSNSCRFASKVTSKRWSGLPRARAYGGPKGARHSDGMSDGEMELEDVEDKLQELMDVERKRQREVKYQILKRQMTPSGAPQRMLTWDAIEQIRYLKKEEPEEWTVERLAESFSVTPDVILRVLRSKFISPPDRRTKQDAKVVARVGQQVLPSGGGVQKDKLKLPGNRTPTILPSGNAGSVLVLQPGQSQLIQGEGSGPLLTRPVQVTALVPQVTPGVCKDATEEKSVVEEFAGTISTEDEDEDGWDGWVLTEEELDEYLELEKPAPAVQVGNDFFDAEGNFLYTI